MRDDYDIVVVGAGVAGLTSALTAVRLGRSVLVLAGAAPGGLLLSIERIDGLPGFPEGVAGYELCPGLQAEADEEGAEIANVELDSFESADGGWVIGTAEGAVGARAVILATGACFRRLGVPGEERLQGHGVSTCASCDGPLLGGKTAAVVGGGDSALQEALALADSVDRVVILHRGDRLSGQASYRVRVAECATIEVRYSTIVEEILGEQTVGALRVREISRPTLSRSSRWAASSRTWDCARRPSDLQPWWSTRTAPCSPTVRYEPRRQASSRPGSSAAVRRVAPLPRAARARRPRSPRTHIWPRASGRAHRRPS